MFVGKLVLLGLVLLPIVAFGLILKHLVSTKPADANKILGKGDKSKGDEQKKVMDQDNKYDNYDFGVKMGSLWGDSISNEVLFDPVYSNFSCNAFYNDD